MRLSDCCRYGMCDGCRGKAFDEFGAVLGACEHPCHAVSASAGSRSVVAGSDDGRGPLKDHPAFCTCPACEAWKQECVPTTGGYRDYGARAVSEQRVVWTRLADEWSPWPVYQRRAWVPLWLWSWVLSRPWALQWLVFRACTDCGAPYHRVGACRR